MMNNAQNNEVVVKVTSQELTTGEVVVNQLDSSNNVVSTNTYCCTQDTPPSYRPGPGGYSEINPQTGDTGVLGFAVIAIVCIVGLFANLKK